MSNDYRRKTGIEYRGHCGGKRGQFRRSGVEPVEMEMIAKGRSRRAGYAQVRRSRRPHPARTPRLHPGGRLRRRQRRETERRGQEQEVGSRGRKFKGARERGPLSRSVDGSLWPCSSASAVRKAAGRAQSPRAPGSFGLASACPLGHPRAPCFAWLSCRSPRVEALSRGTCSFSVSGMPGIRSLGFLIRF